MCIRHTHARAHMSARENFMYACVVSLMVFHRQYHYYSCIGLVCAFSTFHMCPSVLHCSARIQPYRTQHIREAATIEEYSEAGFIRDARYRPYYG